MFALDTKTKRHVQAVVACSSAVIELFMQAIAATEETCRHQKIGAAVK